jgi:hypothetical protein
VGCERLRYHWSGQRGPGRDRRAVIEQGQRDAAANAKDTVNGIVTDDAIVARISEIEAFLKTELAPDVRKLHEDILALRKKQLAATREAEAANDELQRALAAQKDAVDLEAEVRVFVGDQSYATVKSDLCDPEPTPTTPRPDHHPAPTTEPFPVDLDYGDVSDAEAQKILDSDLSDPHNLDYGDDGLACEEGDGGSVVTPSGGVATGGGPA